MLVECLLIGQHQFVNVFVSSKYHYWAIDPFQAIHFIYHHHCVDWFVSDDTNRSPCQRLHRRPAAAIGPGSTLDGLLLAQECSLSLQNVHQLVREAPYSQADQQQGMNVTNPPQPHSQADQQQDMSETNPHQPHSQVGQLQVMNWGHSRGPLFYIALYRKTFKNLLLRNYWTKFDETLPECSLGEALSKLFKSFRFIA